MDKIKLASANMSKSSTKGDDYETKEDQTRRWNSQFPVVYLASKSSHQTWEEAFVTIVRALMFGGHMKKNVPMRAEEHAKKTMAARMRRSHQNLLKPDLEAIEKKGDITSLRWNDSDLDDDVEYNGGDSDEEGPKFHTTTTQVSTFLTPGYEMARIRSEFVQASTAQRKRI